MKRTIPALVLLLLCLLAATAAANSAPLRPTGPTFQPIEATRVRMEHERIEMHVAPVAQADGFNQTLLAQMRIVFRFLPEADETMTAGFPLWPSRFSPLQLAYRLTQFDVRADGEPLPYQEETIQWEGQQVPWAVYTLSFAAGQPMELEVAYEIEFFPGKGHGAPVILHYILKTGALWSGTIGQTEAVVTLDRPLTPDDVLSDTTDGWTVQDGALHWEWRDFEPDFDIAVLLQNRFWLDLPAELEALLVRGNLSRSELLWVHGALVELFGGVLHGYWTPVAGGKPSGEAAIELLPQALAAMRAAMDGDADLQIKYLELLRRSLFRYESGPLRLVSPERLRLYVDEVERLAAAGIRAVTEYGGDEMEWWASFALDTFYGTEDPEARRQSLRPIIALMPERFSSEAGAEGWVERLFRFPTYQMKPELPDGLHEAVLAAAKDRVVAEDGAPASEVGDGTDMAPEADGKQDSDVAVVLDRRLRLLAFFSVPVIAGVGIWLGYRYRRWMNRE